MRNGPLFGNGLSAAAAAAALEMRDAYRSFQLEAFCVEPERQGRLRARAHIKGSFGRYIYLKKKATYCSTSIVKRERGVWVGEWGMNKNKKAKHTLRVFYFFLLRWWRLGSLSGGPSSDSK